MEAKTIKKRFTLADFNEMQGFLQEQHSEGWGFKEQKGSRYIFEKCEPEDFIYRIDVNDGKKDEEEYINLFVDCGWEFILKSGYWFYFRKKRTEAENENEIFSDNATRAEMCKRVLKKQNALLAPLILFIISWDYILLFTDLLKKGTVWSSAVIILFTLILLWVVYHLATFIYSINKLNKLIISYQNPIAKFEDDDK